MAEPDKFDLLEASKRPSAANGEDAPPRSTVASKLLRHLAALRGAGDFSDEELRVAGELISVGAQQLDDVGKDDAALWAELDAEEAAERKGKER